MWGRKLNAQDRIFADLHLLVQRKQISQDYANQINKQLELAPKATIDQISRRVREAANGVNFGVVARYRQALNQALDAVGENPVN
jgi:ElaB/YqjD/DUF883 family membrane-anchored ribosome-binding protein